VEKYAVADTAETENIISAAEELFIKGIKSKDALHVACAIELNCEYFITTDREIIKKLTNFEPIKVISPVDFINYI
jgi:predicted nucleic acid-binding protein